LTSKMQRSNAAPRRRASARIPRNRRRPNYRALFRWFIVAAFLSAAGTYALRTPGLDIDEIQIRGVHLADRAAVEKAGKRALAKNIILLRKSPIVKEIAGLSEVEKVTIDRRFPRKVWINVYERKPYAILTDSREFCMIQRDGLMFHRTDGPLDSIPLIKVETCDSIQPGKIACRPHVTHALTVLNCARKNGLKTAKISVDRRGDMCLNMGSDFYVKLGQPDDIAKKMSLLHSALTCKPSLAKDASYIDLSCPSAAVWMPKAVTRAAS